MQMKTLTTFITIILLTGYLLVAQEARDGNYPFSKKFAPVAYGLSIELATSTDRVEEMMENEFKKISKGSKSKGFKDNLFVVEAAACPRITDATLDYYYRIEPASKKDKANTRLTLFLSAGNFNFRDHKEHANEFKAAKSWLEELGKKANGMEMETVMAAQAEVLKEITKEIEKLKKEEMDLDKKRLAILEEIAKNKQQQETKQQTLIQEERKLNEMREKARKMK